MAVTSDAPGPDEAAPEAPRTTPPATHGNWLFERLPPWVVDTLSVDQREAIHQAIADPAWKRPPVNIRFTVPFIHKKFYVTVVSGAEQRDPARRGRDRHRYPLRTLANVFFFLGAAAVFYAVALVGLAFMSAIIEF